ncbi:MAG: 6-phosphogluconolactonase [Candidatus Dormibacteraceae bacterium]
MRVLPSAEGVAQAAAEEIAEEIAEGARTLVLAGGSTPRRCYQILAETRVRWGVVTILFGDERCLPPDHPDSNFRMAQESLLGRVSPASVHRIPAELGAEEGARLYDPVVSRLRPLDLVILGVGADGHCASLFPGNAALGATAAVVPVLGAPRPPPERVSLGLPVLREARRVIFLATGAEKAGAVAGAARGESPAGMIPGAEWIVDRAAAGRDS